MGEYVPAVLAEAVAPASVACFPDALTVAEAPCHEFIASARQELARVIATQTQVRAAMGPVVAKRRPMVIGPSIQRAGRAPCSLLHHPGVGMAGVRRIPGSMIASSQLQVRCLPVCLFAWTGRKAWQQVQERNSNRRDRLADLVKQAPGSVLLTPGMDVIPVDAVALHGDHVAGVVAVLGTVPEQAPAELGNNDVLW